MFEQKLKSKTEAELASIISNSDQYDPKFLAAAVKEIKNREMSIQTDELETKVEKKIVEQHLKKQKWQVPQDIPRKVLIASNLIFVTAGMTLLNIFFIDSTTTVAGNDFNHLTTFVGAAITAILAYYLRLGASWARGVTLVLFIIGSLPMLATLGYLLEYFPMVAINNFVQLIFCATALVLVFNKQSSQWYKELKMKDDRD